MAVKRRRHLVTAIENGDFGNTVAPGDTAAPGWRLYPHVRATKLRGDYRSLRHGNWQHGAYAKDDGAMFQVRMCRALLKRGLDRFPADFPIPPEFLAPVGWPLFPFVARGEVKVHRRRQSPSEPDKT